MQKFNFLLIVMLFAFSSAFAQQTVTVSGTVKNESGKALVGADIILKGSNYGTVSNNDGSFSIKGITPGMYKMEVSYVGYHNERIKVRVKPNMAPVHVTLRKRVHEISGATITGERIHKTEESLKVMAPLKDIPLTTSTVGQELIQQRQLSNVQDAMRYSTGIAPSMNYGGFLTFKMRGFGGPVIMLDGARDDRMNYSNSAPVTNLAAVEKLEYLKGPAAILYGHSAVGGILNIIRKKPTEKFQTNFSSSYGSWNSKEVMLGSGGALSNKLKYRFDVGLSDRDGWRDNGDKTFNGYMRLDYELNKKNEFTFTAGGNDDFYGTETGIPTVTSDIYDAQTNALLYKKGEHPNGYNREQRYNDPFDYLKHKNYNFSLGYKHKFSETSNLKFNASYTHDIIDYFSTEELSFLKSSNPIYNTYYLNSDNEKTYICLDTLQRTYPLRFSHHTNTYQHYLDYTVQANTGSILHKILVGYYMMKAERTTYTGYDIFDGGDDVQGPGFLAKIAFVNPVLNQGHLETKFSGAHLYNEMVNSLYVQDLLDIHPKVKGLLGLRADFYNMDYQSASIRNEFDEYDHSKKTTQNHFALTYRAGLVYQPINSLSLYGSYANYFRPNRRSYNPDFIYIDSEGQEFDVSENAPFFKPQKGYQLEGGLKYTYNSMIQLNSSVFYIEKNNIIEYLGKNDEGTRMYGQIGVVASKGFDVEAIITPVTGLKITTGYEKTIAKYEEFSNNDYMTSSKEGNYLRGVPQDRFFGWAYYQVTEGFAKNFNVGVGFEYVAEKYLNTSNTATLPAYSLIDANVGYSFNKMYLKLAINNITDENYFSGSVYSNQLIPGYGRNYKFTLGVNL